MKKHKQGFLLIEVLTALSILAIGLLTVTRSFSVSIQANNYSQEYIIAMLLAQTKMTETINQAHYSLGLNTGTFGHEYPSYLWQTETSLINDSLAKVVVTVSWEKRGRESKFLLKTLIPLNTEEI